jgi:hydroxypyruvate isomerase
VTIPPRFAANVAWLFTDVPWLDRFDAARRAGFGQVEFPWPDDPEATATAVRDANLGVALLNMDAGDITAGERGWPNDPSRHDEWRVAFEAAMTLAQAVGCPTINVLAGNRIDAADEDAQRACLVDNLAWALQAARARDIAVVSELLNPLENPQYLLASLDDVDALWPSLGLLGWALQLDTWHLGLTEDDVPAAIRRVAGRIGHVQVADVPGRHEPGTGSLDWASVREALTDAGYRGAIGLEYRPRADTETGLRDAAGPTGWLTTWS